MSSSCEIACILSLRYVVCIMESLKNLRACMCRVYDVKEHDNHSHIAADRASVRTKQSAMMNIYTSKQKDSFFAIQNVPSGRAPVFRLT